MKKKYLFLFILLFYMPVYPQERSDFISYLRNNSSLWKDYENANDMKYYKDIKLYDDTFLVLGLSTSISNFFTLFITDLDKILFAPPIGTQWDNSDTKNKISNIALFISDFDYDGKNDLIGLSQGEPNSTYLSIYSVYNNISLLEVELLDYGINEYQFSWIDYCIINGKKGIRIHVKGNQLTKEEYYYLVGDKKDYSVFHGEIDNYIFYYWSSFNQKYVLDESVTQEQLENAYCPEDYFAYNGLKFSKLDSKLTAEDLKDFDKAQLRLMRNAVYARHGRTFKSVDLQSLWNCYTWYKPNKNYSDELLTEVDKYNIELIQKFESK